MSISDGDESCSHLVYRPLENCRMCMRNEIARLTELEDIRLRDTTNIVKVFVDIESNREFVDEVLGRAGVSWERLEELVGE